MPPPRRPTYDDVKPVLEIVTDEEAGEAKANWDSTIHDYAYALRRKRLCELAVKRVYATLYSQSAETSHERRKLDVEGSVHYKLASEAAVNAEVDFAVINEQRENWKVTIDLWRTVSANRRERDHQENNRGRR